MDTFNCLICYHEKQGPVYEVKEMMFGTGERFSYTQCPRCGTIQQLSPPAHMGRYYPVAYYSFSRLHLSTLPVRWMKNFRFFLYRTLGLSLFRPVYGNWLKQLQAGKNDRIADIGCGSGQLLYEMHACGYHHLSGFDPFLEDSVRVARGLDLFKMDLYQIKEAFDVIMVHHAFEHMKDPDSAFAQLAGLLRPAGRLLIRTPISEGEAWTLFREYWVQLDAPRHYFIPSVGAMTLLARRHGLELFRTEFDSTSFQFWASRRYQEGKSLSGIDPAQLPPAEQMQADERKARSLNKVGKGDQAAFYFRKPG